MVCDEAAGIVVNCVDDADSTSEKTMADLPDHFLSSVIGRLSLRQRIDCSRVCKKWNRCSRDPSIWSVIDLRECKRNLSLQDLKRVISQYGSASAKELLICGNLTFDYVPMLNMQALHITEKYQPKRLKKVKITHLDTEFLSDFLVRKCPNLTLISLEYLDLAQIELGDFLGLKRLQTFSLRWCKITASWFDLSDSQKQFTSLNNLYLIRTGLLTINDTQSICTHMPNLITLTINQAVSSLGDDSIEIICHNLLSLKQLDLINTVLSDNAVTLICNSPHLRLNLTRLNLTMSSKISNACLHLISENLGQLSSLYLTSCFGISNISFLQNMKTLDYLNINNTSIDKSRIKEFLLPQLPKCEVEYGHEKILRSKSMWTINSSRNSVCSF